MPYNKKKQRTTMQAKFSVPMTSLSSTPLVGATVVRADEPEASRREWANASAVHDHEGEVRLPSWEGIGGLFYRSRTNGHGSRLVEPELAPTFGVERSQTNSLGTPLELGAAAEIEAFRQVLETHGYAEKGLRQLLGKDLHQLHVGVDLPLYERRVARPCPLATLTKLFLLHVWVDEWEARSAFVPLSLETVAWLGLVEIGTNGVRGTVTLSVGDGLVFAHDVARSDGAALASDCVLGLNPAAMTMARLTVRRRVRRALDVGTGCGVQALLAARHAERVVAVDTNPRALMFTEFNARLNRTANVECRRGSLFEPVSGERFDLIVCNPPYVISPESQYEYRDSGLPGDQICEQVVLAAPEHLTEGGFACVLCNWAQGKTEDWLVRPRSWLAENGCDGLVFRGATQDPLSYASNWTRTRDGLAYGRALDSWLEYYRDLGIESLSSGAVVMRRRSGGQNWLRAEELPSSLSGSCSDHLLRLVAAEDFLAEASEPMEILGHAFVLFDDHRLTQTSAKREGGFAVQTMELQMNGGLRFHGTVDPYTLHLLTRCDGNRPLAEVVKELHQARGGDRSELEEEVSAIVRRLIAAGFLAPAKGAAAREPVPLRGGDGAKPNVTRR